MRSPSADELLELVRRRLRAEHRAAALRTAARLTTLAAAVAATLHLLVRPVGLAELGLAVALTWALAALGAGARQVDAKDCADWTDRHLDGACAFATYVEHRDSASVPPVVANQLLDGLHVLASRGEQRLRGFTLDARLRKPVALAAVALTLAGVLLLLPTQDRLSAATSNTTDPGVARVPPLESDDSTGKEPESTRALSSPADGATPSPATGPGASPAAGATVAEARPDAQEAQRSAPGGTTSERAGTGGREAGRVADRRDDAALTGAWQGEIAVRFRELATPEEAATRADAALEATYLADATGAGAAPAAPGFAVAPAVAPEARDAPELSPVERAYLRAYLAQTGVVP